MIAEPRTQWGKSLTQHDLEAEEAAQAPAWVKDMFGTAKVPDEIRETVSIGYGDPREVWLTCEVVSPVSTRRRTVDVHIPAEQVLAVLKLLRRAAAAQRDQAMA